MRKLVFRDTEAFYSELKAALEQDEQIEVITDYERYSDLPERLITIFELHKHKSGTWVNVATGAFIPYSTATTGINYNALYGIIRAAGVGAILGLTFGGPIGAAVGGGIGAIAGVMATAISSEKHEVVIEIRPPGIIVFRITPTKGKRR